MSVYEMLLIAFMYVFSSHVHIFHIWGFNICTCVMFVFVFPASSFFKSLCYKAIKLYELNISFLWINLIQLQESYWHKLN